MVNYNYLFIEGTTDTTNGDLREGFRRLLEQVVTGDKKMPRIAMGRGKNETLDKFTHTPGSRMLCDLDGPEATRQAVYKELGIQTQREMVFFMIQEMEAWIISQPNVLDAFFKQKISQRLAKKPAIDFNEPDKELQRITKDTPKGSYHKIRHGVPLMIALDARKLYADFEDFKRLVDALNA